MLVKFVVSPTGKYNLAYSPGDEVEIDDDLGLLLVTECFAQRMTPPGGGEETPPGNGHPGKEDRTSKKPKEKR
jgi:hypothetical protein